MRTPHRLAAVRAHSGVTVLAIAALALSLMLTLACGSSPSNNTGGVEASGDGALTVNPSQAKPGQVLTVRGNGMPKGEEDPIVRGELFVAAPEGDVSLASINIFNRTFTQTASVPASLSPGEHTIVLKLKGEHAGKEITTTLTVLAP